MRVTKFFREDSFSLGFSVIDDGIATGFCLSMGIYDVCLWVTRITPRFAINFMAISFGALAVTTALLYRASTPDTKTLICEYKGPTAFEVWQSLDEDSGYWSV